MGWVRVARRVGSQFAFCFQFLKLVTQRILLFAPNLWALQLQESLEFASEHQENMNCLNFLVGPFGFQNTSFFWQHT